MRARYENWVNGLNGDWCVSRQRFFGVPFPVWYPISIRRHAGLREHPIAPPRIDCRSIRRPMCPRLPRRSARRARRLHRRSRRDGHLGDLVAVAADSWRLARRRGPVRGGRSRWIVRPQAHDIIRTWLFSSVLRAHLEHDSLPWANAAISGFDHSIRIARRCRSRRATS